MQFSHSLTVWLGVSLGLISCLFLPSLVLAAADGDVLCLGNSVTAGHPYENTANTYPAKLQVLLNNTYGSDVYNVINQGVSGYRADQVLDGVQNKGWLTNNDPDFVLLMVGGNDLNQGQSIASTVAEVQAIIDEVNSYKNSEGEAPTLIVSTFIPNRLYGIYGSAYVKLYNDQLESELTGYDLLTTDNWYDFYDSGSGMARANLMADNTHPNATGYSVMAENWLAALNTFPTPAGSDAPSPSDTPTTERDGLFYNPQIIVSSGPGAISKLQIYNRYGEAVTTQIHDLFPESYLGGAGVISLDADNNGVKDEITVFAASNGGPQARVMSVKEGGNLSLVGQMFVFDQNIRDGLSMTAGDFDDDGYVDDVAACLTGDREPIVRVYKDVRGVDNWEKIGEFKAPFESVGCNVGTFQYDDKADEVLVSPHHGSACPVVYIYTVGGTLKKNFFAYGTGVRNGLTPSGIGDRIYTTPNNGSSHVNVFDSSGTRQNFWWAYQQFIRGDFKNVAGDIDVDGKDEILISPIGANGPQVLAFEPDGHWRTWPNFFAFGDKTLRNGVGVAVIDNWFGEN